MRAIGIFEVDREVIYMRYYQDRTQREVGQRIGVTQMQVSRIETKAMERLREAMDPDDNAALDDLFAFHQRLGLQVRRLRAKELREVEPHLSPRVRGGILVEAHFCRPFGAPRLAR